MTTYKELLNIIAKNYFKQCIKKEIKHISKVRDDSLSGWDSCNKYQIDWCSATYKVHYINSSKIEIFDLRIRTDNMDLKENIVDGMFQIICVDAFGLVKEAPDFYGTIQGLLIDKKFDKKKYVEDVLNEMKKESLKYAKENNL